MSAARRLLPSPRGPGLAKAGPLPDDRAPLFLEALARVSRETGLREEAVLGRAHGLDLMRARRRLCRALAREGWTAERIAAVVGRSVAQVKFSLHGARQA